MPTDTKSLDAAARDELARKADVTRLEGLAKDAIVARREKERCVNELRFDEAAMYRGIEVGAERSLREYCTPDVILALLASVERGEADTARIDFLEAFCDDLTFYHSRGGEPEPVLSWFAGDGDSVTQTQGPTWRAAIDAALDAARAHPPTQETDDAE